MTDTASKLALTTLVGLAVVAASDPPQARVDPAQRLESQGIRKVKGAYVLAAEDDVFRSCLQTLAAMDEANQAITRLEQFVRSVPAAGRAEMRANGPLTLSIVAPDQYRGQLLDLIATDARAIAARFGPEQRVEAQGLDRPVEWRRAGITEVFLYIPHRLVFRPAG